MGKKTKESGDIEGVENDSEQVLDVVEVVLAEVLKKTIDMSNGKVNFFTSGYEDGAELKVNINGDPFTLIVNDNHAVFANGWAFKQYPAIIY